MARFILSKAQREAIRGWIDRELGLAIGLIFWFHNLFFLGFLIPVLCINIGNYILFPKKKNTFTTRTYQRVFNFWISILFTSIVLQFIYHNAFSLGYQVGIVITLLGSWITLKLYKKKQHGKMGKV